MYTFEKVFRGNVRKYEEMCKNMRKYVQILGNEEKIVFAHYLPKSVHNYTYTGNVLRFLHCLVRQEFHHAPVVRFFYG